MRSGSRGADELRRAYLLAACAGLLLVGCGSTEGPRAVVAERDLFDPSPSRRTAAVAAVAQSGDRQWIPRLVELLDDSDPAVRALANQTLEDLTGRETGYAAYAPAAERRTHVDAWQAWLEAERSPERVVPEPAVDTDAGSPWSAPRVDGPRPGAGR